ncbi:AAA family ATPase [Candidatus Woesearchaeota archaeon]|nr:AAA family ATPase [Candidatus Woesearchaeota archaeon]
MLIKSIKLENIRSYTKQEINFPSGSTLLSGDIGSGKSTILLALEFALFGICGKALPGSSLLRNGKNTGAVEVKLSINEKDIIIKRTLKRTKDSVTQSAGYIVKSGIKKDATAVELKASVLELLGYPKELLTKTKNIVYRFTVYTPQEEMKQILLEPEETRMDTLRKVFGIDRYKKIKENTGIFAKQLKEKIKLGQGEILDLKEKKALKIGYNKEIREISKKIKEITPKLDKLNKSVSEKKKSIEKIESDMQEFNKLRNELDKLDIELRIKVEQRNNNNVEMEKIDIQVKDIQKELLKELPNIDELKKSMQEKLLQMSQKERLLNGVAEKIGEYNAVIKNAENVKQKILNIARCPTCEQNVSKEHKDSILSRENSKIYDSQGNINAQKQHEALEKERLNQLKQEYDVLQVKETEIKLADLKRKSLLEKKVKIQELVNMQEQIKNNIGKINSRKIELNGLIEKYSGIEEEHKKIKPELDKLQSEERQAELEKNSFESKKLQIEKTLELVKQEIERKLKTKEKIKYYSELHNWLNEHFIKLMSVIEKHIMAKAHYDFNEIFQHWFNILIEDETLNIRLDDKFTPVVEQNGYEISINHLSGGERTAAALAYRLALNKVINEMMSEIKTRDIIILDEPTDGFSTEQLDRVRDVLEQINAKQAIIVSHETKIETFVDNVIRVNKNEHVSEIGI